MSETIDTAVKVLSNWPVAEGFFIIVIAFLGIITYRRGEKDRRQLSSGAVEIPLFLLSGPLANAMDSVQHIANAAQETNKSLDRLVETLEETNRLMEEVRNYQVMYGTSWAGGGPTPKSPRGR